jgi:Protein of unknown function (DUF3987)
MTMDDVARRRRERIEADANREAEQTFSVVPKVEAPTAMPKPESEAPWPLMDEPAYYGLAGDIVRTIDPHTESDNVAILLQTLTVFGSVVGSNPYFQVESTKHRANLFSLLIGKSSKSRKGTSMDRVVAFFFPADPTWPRPRSGLSSAEGLVMEVRDKVERWNAKDKAHEIVDPGVTDKRCLVVESEFAAVLRNAERTGNKLSPTLRDAWDCKPLRTMTKNSPLQATDPHISIIGHITEEELRMNLTRTDMANGYANRHLFALVKRSKLLPDGGNLSDEEITRLSGLIGQAIEHAKPRGRVERSDEARDFWHKLYSTLSQEQAGLVGSIVARAEAQVVRLSLLYALMERSEKIEVAHLKAALAIWEYCEASAARIFGKMVGDPVADEILRALQQTGAHGMTRTALRDMFARSLSAGRLSQALDLLRSRGLARMEIGTTGPKGGRPAETWFATMGG